MNSMINLILVQDKYINNFIKYDNNYKINLYYHCNNKPLINVHINSYVYIFLFLYFFF